MGVIFTAKLGDRDIIIATNRTTRSKTQVKTEKIVDKEDDSQ